MLWPCFRVASGVEKISPVGSGSFAQTAYGYFGVALFVAAFLLVIFEEQLHFCKRKPVMLAAGLIWVLVALAYAARGVLTLPIRRSNPSSSNMASGFSLCSNFWWTGLLSSLIYQVHVEPGSRH